MQNRSIRLFFFFKCVDHCSEKLDFLSQQSFSFITQPAKGSPLSTVTTSISLFKTPLHSLGWVLVTQTINISALPFRVMP